MGFEADIKPLFRELDRQEMLFAFDLWDYDDVKGHAQEIIERVYAGDMPCDSPWPPHYIDRLIDWYEHGMPP